VSILILYIIDLIIIIRCSTGLKGKGVLKKLGKNGFCDPVITRVDPRTRRMQVLVCSSLESPGTWCLPGGTISDSTILKKDQREVILPDQRQLPQFLAKVCNHNYDRLQADCDMYAQSKMFIHSNASDPVQRLAFYENTITTYFHENSVPRYKGYCDDPRNTDDAWIETVVYHTHFHDGWAPLLDIPSSLASSCPSSIESSTNRENTIPYEFRWIPIDSGLPAFTGLYASHYHFVQLCAPTCKCGRREFDQTDGSHEPGPPVAGCIRADTLAADDSAAAKASNVGTGGNGCGVALDWKADEQWGGRSGRIQFLGQTMSSCFVRAQMETRQDELHVRSLLDAWGLQQPRALIAVTGGAQDFDLGHGMEEAVFQGILQAATAVQASIIDGGTDAGVMKLLGNAAQRSGHRLNLIGMTGWGCVIGREALAGRPTAGQSDECIPYAKTQPSSASGAGLDPNHTFFVLVDDGSAGQFGREIRARAQLEALLRNTRAFESFQRILLLSCEVLMAKSMDVVGGSPVEGERGGIMVREHIVKEVKDWPVTDLIQLWEYWQYLSSNCLNEKLLPPAAKKAAEGEMNSQDQSGLRLQLVDRLVGAMCGLEEELLVKKGNLCLKEQHDIEKAMMEAQTLQNTSMTSDSFKRIPEGLPEGDDLRKFAVDHCFQCPGSYRDNITLELRRNSIRKKEVDDWYKIQNEVKVLRTAVSPQGQYLPSCKNVDCSECRAVLSWEDIEGEEFFACTGTICDKACDHYFFRTRAIELRHRGREQIICENCRARAQINDILGQFIPSVLVVVQGGPGTIKTVASTNAQDDKKSEDASGEAKILVQSQVTCTPILVVAGSGKAADFIASTWRHMHEGPTRKCYDVDCPRSKCVAFKRQYKDKNGTQLVLAHCPYIQNEYRKYLQPASKLEAKALADKIIGAKGVAGKVVTSYPSEEELNINNIIDTCRRKEAVTIYDVLKDKHGLSYAIMKAICNGTLKYGQPLSTVEKMKLAMEWDREVGDTSSTPVLVAQEIMAEENLELAKTFKLDEGRGLHINNQNFEKALLEALACNSWRIVSLLMRSGVTLPGRDSVLKTLYRDHNLVQSSNEEAIVPNCLSDLMRSSRVKTLLLRRTYTNFCKGVFSDEYCWNQNSDPAGNGRSDYIWTYATSHLLGLTAIEINKYFKDGKHLTSMSFTKFQEMIKPNELFGTKAHIECVMLSLKWSKYCDKDSTSKASSKLQAPGVCLPANKIQKSSAQVSDHTNSKHKESDNEKSKLREAKPQEANSHLFIWAILMGRTELAKIFWSNCEAQDKEHGISRALFAAAVARRLANSSWADSRARELLVGGSDDGDSLGPTQRIAFAVEFEDLAIRLMQLCYNKDPAAAVQAVALEWTSPGAWVDVSGPSTPQSPFRLAEHARAERFVDAPAFQACVAETWFGGIVAARPSRKLVARVSLGERVQLPLAGDSWVLTILLVSLSGGAAIPALFVSAFLGDFSLCVAVVTGSYAVPVLVLICFTYYYNPESKGDSAGGHHSCFDKFSGHQNAAAYAWWSWPYRLWRTSVVIYGAPVVKFYGRSCHFFLFVLLYTYVGVLLNPAVYTHAEGVMQIWLLLLVLTKLRSAVVSGFNHWSSEFWNLLDTAWMVGYAAAAAVRGMELAGVQMVESGGVPLSKRGGYNATDGSYSELGHRIVAAYRVQFEDLVQARGLHGAVGILLWTRLLKIFTVDTDFGPLVLTLLAMVKDVARFALLLLVLASGFSAALLCAARPYPDRSWRCSGGAALGETYDGLVECAAACDGQCQSQLWRGLSNTLSEAYFQLYGEHFLGVCVCVCVCVLVCLCACVRVCV
jgi:hypothetical protein